MSTSKLPQAGKKLLLDICRRRRALRWRNGWKPDWPGSALYKVASGQSLITRGLAEIRFGPGPAKLHLTQRGEDVAYQILETRRQRQSA